ncbi:FAD dependent oxidoreductase [Vararia minispora EC-137]|uniref:FAD dependent oxidoreductase n=1 Tax=Vararia minispora EC-137 TaxID=1314806 RepID=A0ACB8QJR7_9AGAM|nr:FAD dependent oxidoreductase [Vararia minispora EC-137]
METPKSIVIIGAGIIGSTTAFYLSRHPSLGSAQVIILEASKSGAAQGASGKAGGLVAKWAYPNPLTRISFHEHVRLAEEFNGADRWGWRWVSVGEWEGRGAPRSNRRVGTAPEQTTSLQKKAGLSSPTTSVDRQAKGLPEDLSWVNANLTESFSLMAPPGDTAQVHPYLFTTSMLDLSVEYGVRLVRGRATTIERVEGKVSGVRYADSETGVESILSADCVILAAGAWCPTLLPDLPVTGTRAHSIVIRPPPNTPVDSVSPYVLFTSIRLPNSRRSVTPEIYPRPNPEIYVCGPGDTRVPLPQTVDDVQVDVRACDEIWEWVAETGVLESWALGEVSHRQACYLPIVSAGGGPIISAIPGTQGLVVATGHTCWGICNAPGTAKAVSELVLDGKIKCADLTALDLTRYL